MSTQVFYAKTEEKTASFLTTIMVIIHLAYGYRKVDGMTRRVEEWSMAEERSMTIMRYDDRRHKPYVIKNLHKGTIITTYLDTVEMGYSREDNTQNKEC